MKRGFTLVELLIYMALLGPLLIVLTNILVTSLESQVESTTASIVDIDGRFILNRLIYDVTHAASINLPAAAGQSSASLGLNTGTYSLSGSNLLLGTDRLNSFDSQVSNLSVTRVGNGTRFDTVIVSFTVTSGSTTRSYTTALGLR